MCGIIGYIGQRRAEDVLLDGLRRLEYRGYDSAGMATLHEGDIKSAKMAGRVVKLADLLSRAPLPGNVGIAHTRWATHGEPNDINAHPHFDCRGRIALVHNGIIENHGMLRTALVSRRHRFSSVTDTEVIAHLIEEYAETLAFEDAVAAALRDLIGTFGLAAVSADVPGTVIGARRGSPLVVGIGKDELVLASDASAVVPYTRDVVYLDDDEMAVLTSGGMRTSTLDREPREKTIERVEWSVGEIERGRYPHFMLKEMHEQPDVAVNVLRGRLDLAAGGAVLGGLADVEERLRGIGRLTVAACGSASLAGRIGALMLEEYADIPTACEPASEYRYRKSALDPASEAVIAVSQSGETADTIGALREAKRKGALTLGIVNAVGSTVARETDAGIFTYAGPEIAVASTKAFLAQIGAFAVLTLYLGRRRRMSLSTGTRIVEELGAMPKKIAAVLGQADRIRALAKKYAAYPNAMYLGRKYGAPVAMEGALKLKEIAYVHAEGYAAGEMKHGPIALLEPSFPVIAVTQKDSVHAKMLSNLEEVKARRAPLLVIASEGDEDMARLADDIIFVPRTLEMLSPMLTVIPLQMFAYFVAVERGLDPDKPRNLAKSVTVE